MLGSRVRIQGTLAVVAAALLAGCGDGGGTSVDSLSGLTRAFSESVTLIPFSDQWSNQPRWRDVGDVLFSSTFRSTYSSTAGGLVTFEYDPAPGVGWLTGRLSGVGLKPNSVYQMKLVGKPGGTSGLWTDGTADMATNEYLLRNARWWNYKTEDATFTTTDDDAAAASTDYQDGWVAGYVYFGYFVTNELGQAAWATNASGTKVSASGGWLPITVNRCYHITWKAGQTGTVSTSKQKYNLIRTNGYGYSGINNRTAKLSTSLWYEKEPDDPMNLPAMPAGQHRVVLMITEESFHSSLTDGGKWLTVMVSGWPTIASPKTGQAWVTSPGSEIVFTTP